MKKTHLLLNDLKKNRIKWLMLVPAAVAVILMCYIPMTGIVLAFKEFNYQDGIFGSPWRISVIFLKAAKPGLLHAIQSYTTWPFWLLILFSRLPAPFYYQNWRTSISNASRSR